MAVVVTNDDGQGDTVITVISDERKDIIDWLQAKTDELPKDLLDVYRSLDEDCGVTGIVTQDDKSVMAELDEDGRPTIFFCVYGSETPIKGVTHFDSMKDYSKFIQKNQIDITEEFFGEAC